MLSIPGACFFVGYLFGNVRIVDRLLVGKLAGAVHTGATVDSNLILFRRVRSIKGKNDGLEGTFCGGKDLRQSYSLKRGLLCGNDQKNKNRKIVGKKE